MDPARARKLAHLSYVAPLVAVVIHAQAESILARGDYAATLAILLLVVLLLGGFLSAVYAFAHSAEDPRQRFPAAVGVVSNLVAAGLITFWLTGAA